MQATAVLSAHLHCRTTAIFCWSTMMPISVVTLHARSMAGYMVAGQQCESEACSTQHL